MITQEQITEAFKKASPEVQAMVNSDDVFNAFHEIREKHNLHLDHAGNLATAINAVILEIVPFTELDTLLKEGMQGVDDAVRAQVIQDVNDKIFVPLREETRKHAVEVAKINAAPPVVAPPPRTTPLAEIPLVMIPNPSQPSAPSVLEQKMPSAQPTPAPAPQPEAPAKPKSTYHGTDPYREMPE
jgi:cell fate (sporulation/competence/biofilm development) regulator YlbF (YheA/YmcA/DUF963 family)